MDTLMRFLHFETWFLLIGLISIVVYRILTGQINTKGMLTESNGSGKINPARLQLLAITVGSAFLYLIQVAENPSKFPDPQVMLVALGGSNVVYLATKAYSLLLRR
jgi:hypothetical protein